MTSQNHQTNLDIAQQYIAFFNEMPLQAEKFKTFVDPGIIWQEMPNLFSPTGRTGGLSTMLDGMERGNKLLKEQQYTIRQAVASQDSVALEIKWEAVMAQQLAKFPPGTQLSANVAIFLGFRGGKIISQHDYVCYGPLPNPVDTKKEA
jgi:ketosteroid isomerase-like protein